MKKKIYVVYAKTRSRSTQTVPRISFIPPTEFPSEIPLSLRFTKQAKLKDLQPLAVGDQRDTIGRRILLEGLC